MPVESVSVKADGRRGLLLVSFVLGLWLVIKIVLFLRWEYTSDLFSFLQMSYSWMDGKPVLWENCFGVHSHLHNYYGVLLLGPLTRVLSVYGLFGGYVALLAASLIVATADVKHPWFYLTFALGPISWWMFDDPVYGWHGELLMVPFGILYAEGIRRNRWWQWIAAAGLCTVREEGPVVAWAIYAAVSLGRQSWKRLAAVTGAFLIVFLAGWWRLYAGNHAREVLGRMTWTSAPMLQWLCLVAPLLIACFLVRRRSALHVGMALLPVAFLTYVAGVQRYPDLYLGMAWSPRVTLAWAVGLAVMAFELRSRSPRWYWAFALLAWQLTALSVVRDYHLFARIWKSGQSRAYVLTTPAEKRFLRQVAHDMPARYTIATNGDYFTVFHRQSVAWPNVVTVVHPDMIVCDTKNRVLYEISCLTRLDASRMPTARVGGLLIGYSPEATYLFGSAALTEPALSKAVPAVSPPNPHNETGSTAAQILIPAERFDRGTVLVDNGQFRYGKGIGVILTPTAPAFAEYDFNTAQAANYRVELRYASAVPRLVRLVVDGQLITDHAADKATGGFFPEHQEWQEACIVSLEPGKHTLRLESGHVFPHIDELRLTQTKQAATEKPSRR